MTPHRNSRLSASVGILLASLAVLSRSMGAPTLCMQPITQEAYNQTYTYMVAIPGKKPRVAVVDAQGKIYSLDLPPPGKALPTLNRTLLLDLGPRLADWTGVGIQGLAFHPQYPETGRMFVSYVCNIRKWDRCNSVSPDGSRPMPYCACDEHSQLCKGKGCQNVLVVDEFYAPVDGGPAVNETVTRVAAIGQAYRDNIGGEILFYPYTSLLYMATGDGGAALRPARLSQNLTSPLGKILRMDIDVDVDISVVKARGFLGQYAPPEDNDNFNKTGVGSALYAVGLRDPAGCAAYTPDPGSIICTDMGRDSSNDVVLVATNANYGWPTCSSSWFGPKCSGSLLSYPTRGIKTEPFGGAKLLRSGYLGSGDDLCKDRWLLQGYSNGTMLASREDKPQSLSFPGEAEVVTPKCAATPCDAPNTTISWMRNPLFLPEGQFEQQMLSYAVTNKGIFQVVDPGLCGSPCGPDLPPTVAEGGGTGSTPATNGTTPSANSSDTTGNPPGGNSSGSNPSGATPSGGTTPANPVPVTTSGGQEDTNSFLRESGIDGAFDSAYWAKLAAIFGVMLAIICSICCFFIIMGWKEGRKKDQRFLELKQAEADLDERTRDPDDDNMVYQPAGDPEEDDGKDYGDEDGTEYNEEMSEDDESMSQYSSRHGPDSASGRSASTRSRRQGGDGESDAGTDYTGYTGYSGRTGQTGYSSRTGRSGTYTGAGTESTVSRSRRGDGMSDAQSYTTRDDWTDTASGYGP